MYAPIYTKCPDRQTRHSEGRVAAAGKQGFGVPAYGGQFVSSWTDTKAVKLMTDFSGYAEGGEGKLLCCIF